MNRTNPEMDHPISSWLCEHICCSLPLEVSACWLFSPTALEDTAPKVMLYTNGRLASVHPDWLDVGANPRMVIGFFCVSGRSFEDPRHFLQAAMTAFPSLDVQDWSFSRNSAHACGLLVLSSGALQSVWKSDVILLLRRLLIDPMCTRLWRRPNIPFDLRVTPARLGDGAASISPESEDEDMPDAGPDKDEYVERGGDGHRYDGQGDAGHGDGDVPMGGM